jgi:hypothetical protein
MRRWSIRIEHDELPEYESTPSGCIPFLLVRVDDRLSSSPPAPNCSKDKTITADVAIGEDRPDEAPSNAGRASTGPWTATRVSKAGSWLYLLALALVLTTFVISNPPGFASDEPAHLFRAAGLAHGQVLGDPAPPMATPFAWTPAMVAWTQRTSRAYRLPRRSYACMSFPIVRECRSTLPVPAPTGASTLAETSYVGTYPPAPYLAPAVGIRIAEAFDAGPATTVRAARGAGALLDFALLVLAAALLTDFRRRAGLLGLTLAATPLTLFTMAQVSDSGLEIAAGLCFAAALLRLVRSTEMPTPGWVWGTLAGSGALFATARSTGPLWVPVTIAAVVALHPYRIKQALRAAPRAAVVSALIVAAADLTTVLWDATILPHPDATSPDGAPGLPLALTRLGSVAEQAVGQLRWLNVSLPPVVVGLWWVLLVGLLAAALVVGTAHQRVVLLVLCASVVVLVLAIDIVLIQKASIKFPMQARYVYPPFLLIPLLSAHVVAEQQRVRARPAALLAETVSAIVPLVAVALLFVATQTNAASYANWPAMTPPLGWPFWQTVALVAVAAAAVGTVAKLAATVAASRRI